MRKLLNFLKYVSLTLLVFLFLVWLISLLAPKAQKIEYGVTFSQPYAESLGLDWKQTYLNMLKDLKPETVRISAYWNLVEGQKGQYYFDDVDFQVDEAAKAGSKIVLAVGRRLPRWPECHDPSWLNKLSKEELENSQLAYVAAVVERYQNRPGIDAWQVENEAFLSTFGECPPLDSDLLDSEIALVKKTDPTRKIIITDSGELNFWLYASARGDVFGTTLYRYVYSDIFNRYWTNHLPPLFYRFKAGLVRLLHPGKPIAIMELQAEPWTPEGVLLTSVDEQMITMNMENFKFITKLAKDTGFSPNVLWGVEWWYYMKEKHNRPEFLDYAKELMKR